MASNDNSLHTTASPSNLGPVFLGVDWAVFSLSTIVVLIRLYTRIWITRNVGWDDAVMAFTQVYSAKECYSDMFLICHTGDYSCGERLRGHRDELRIRTT